LSTIISSLLETKQKTRSEPLDATGLHPANASLLHSARYTQKIGHPPLRITELRSNYAGKILKLSWKRAMRGKNI